MDTTTISLGHIPSQTGFSVESHDSLDISILRDRPSGFTAALLQKLPLSAGSRFPFFWSLTAQRPTPPHLQLEVRIDPGTKHLESKARFEMAADQWPKEEPIIWLCEDLRIDSLTINGKACSLTPLDNKDYKLRFQTKAKPYRIEGFSLGSGDHNVVLELNYSGNLGWEPDSKGGITESDVELALYSTWFPQLNGIKEFSHDLTLSLPSDFQAVSNGNLEEQSVDDHWVTYRWADRQGDAIEDINVLASKRFNSFEIDGKSGFSVKIYGANLKEDLAEELLQSTDRVLQFYSECFGPLPGNHREVTMAIMPREGQSYSRLPLFVLSEKWVTNSKNKNEAPQVIAHELAHFWWNKADTNSTDDWINEGLAEYGSFLAVENAFGTEKADKLYEEALLAVAGHKFEKPIAQTYRTEEGGNYFYPLGILTFSLLRDTLGDEIFFRILRKLLKIGNSRKVTTEDVASLARRYGGDEGTNILDQWILGIPRVPEEHGVPPNQNKRHPVLNHEQVIQVFGDWCVGEAVFENPNTVQPETIAKLQTRHDELSKYYEADLRLLYCRGQIHYFKGDFEAALASFDEAFKTVEKDDITVNLFGPMSLKGFVLAKKGMMLDLLGRREEAVAVYQEIIKSPDPLWFAPRIIAVERLEEPLTP